MGQDAFHPETIVAGKAQNVQYFICVCKQFVRLLCILTAAGGQLGRISASLFGTL
jgi:hypothetical protein